MVITPEDIAKFPTGDLKIMHMEVKHVLTERKRVALRKFRAANPVLGWAVALGEDSDSFIGFAEKGQAFPPWVYVIIEKETHAKPVKVHNEDLKGLLVKAMDDKAQVFYNPSLNTAKGEEWLDEDLTIDV